MRRRFKRSTDNLFPPIRFPSLNFDEGDGDPGGSGGPTGGGNGPTGGEGFQIESGGSIWDIPTHTGGTPTGSVAPAHVTTPTGGTPTPADSALAQFESRVAGLTFDDLTFDETQMTEIFDNRDFSALNAHIHKSLRAVYKNSMIDSVRMMNTMQEKIMSKIRSEAQIVTTQNDNINALRAALPFTANPNVSPIADAALNTQLGAGKNINEAIETVRAFFKQSAEISSKDLGLNLPPSGDPGSGNFRQGAEDEPVDWEHLLSGGVVKQAGE